MIDNCIILGYLFLLFTSTIESLKSNKVDCIVLKNLCLILFLICILIDFIDFKYAYQVVVINLCLDYIIKHHYK